MLSNCIFWVGFLFSKNTRIGLSTARNSRWKCPVSAWPKNISASKRAPSSVEATCICATCISASTVWKCLNTKNSLWIMWYPEQKAAKPLGPTQWLLAKPAIIKRAPDCWSLPGPRSNLIIFILSTNGELDQYRCDTAVGIRTWESKRRPRWVFRRSGKAD